MTLRMGGLSLLSSGGAPQVYIQSAEDENGWVVEWQSGELDNHWTAVTDDLPSLIAAFHSFLEGSNDYRRMFPFEKLDLS